MVRRVGLDDMIVDIIKIVGIILIVAIVLKLLWPLLSS